MQFIFETNDIAKKYSYKVPDGHFPEAPQRCPHKGCKIPVQMKKHGYYKRNILLKGFSYAIRVRRYKCPACGKTVSMLPAFCIPFLQYGAEVVIWLMGLAVKSTVRAASKACVSILPAITRRHIAYWLARIRSNKDLILYWARQMSPATATANEGTEDKRWTDFFLSEAGKTPEKFNADFHKITGKSFMSLQTSVA